MYKHLFPILAVFAMGALPAVAEESPEQLAVKARANILACALEMLSMEGGEKYPDALAKGIRKQAHQMDQIESIIDDLDEDKVLEAENRLVNSANFAKLAADYRGMVRALALRMYYGSQELQDALEDLEDEIRDME